jgi:hypothetical protein
MTGKWESAADLASAKRKRSAAVSAGSAAARRWSETSSLLRLVFDTAALRGEAIPNFVQNYHCNFPGNAV